MAQPSDAIPKRLRTARRWQWLAASASALFVATCFVGWPLGFLWPSVVGLIGFLPAVWLFNTSCYSCGYPAFANYQADEALRLDDRFWTRFWGKEYGGVRLSLRHDCSKCGARFVSDEAVRGNAKASALDPKLDANDVGSRTPDQFRGDG